MSSVSAVVPVSRLPARPAAAGVGRGRVEPARRSDPEPALRGPVGGPVGGLLGAPRPRGTGRGAYAAATYAAVAALRPAPADDAAVEVSVRALAGGGRVTVARRTTAGATVGIEARVA